MSNLIDIVFNTGFAFVGGFTYGSICNKLDFKNKVDEMLAAKAFVISSLTFDIFRTILLVMVDQDRLSTRTFHAVAIIGTAAWGAASIIAFRHLNLIANQGTMLMSGYLAFNVIRLIVAVNSL